MLLVMHIIVAISGLILSGLAAVYPSRAKINAAGIGVTATLATGLGLIIITHGQLTQFCLSGLGYLAATMPLIALSLYRVQRSRV